MSKRKKTSVLVANNRHAFKHYRHIAAILTGTAHASCTKKGVISISGSGAGVAVGECYLAVDTAGTGTIITP